MHKRINQTKILITGSAGFIGHHLAQRFGREGYDVTGVDNLNTYYDQGLKRSRLAVQGFSGSFEYGTCYNSINGDSKFVLLDLTDKNGLNQLFMKSGFDYVINLAAQAGVRYSLTNPQLYIDSNITGFLNVLECCRAFPVKHLVFASSSSVYGLNEKIPFVVSDETSHPISLYAASKKSNELMAHTYSHLFSLPITGLRFFTVYGPWGRPDMALFLFTRAILEGKPFDVFNGGEMSRDFTYVDDICESIFRLIGKPPSGNGEFDPTQPKPNRSSAPYQLFNIGNNRPVSLLEFIRCIESATGKTAHMLLKPMQPGDVPSTYADVEDLFDYTGFRPATNIEEGVASFVEWYKQYYHISRAEKFAASFIKNDVDVKE